MSSISTARYHQDKSQPAKTRETGGMGGEKLPHSPLRILGAFATALDKSTKPIVSQSSGESLNNRTRSANATNINRHHQSLAQVR
jgi:hypothetical protein